MSRTCAGRRDTFTELCCSLAAHEAAEEECIHAPGKEELDGDTTVVDKRVEEEEVAGKAITELEQLGTNSSEFPDKFEQLRQAVIAHAEAEEHQVLPKLSGVLDEADVARIDQALTRVPSSPPAKQTAAGPSRIASRRLGRSPTSEEHLSTSAAAADAQGSAMIPNCQGLPA